MSAKAGKEKISQLQNLLLGVTEAVKDYLLDDVAGVLEEIHDMEDVRAHLAVVKTVAAVNQHLAEFPIPPRVEYEEPSFNSETLSAEFIKFQQKMHYALWLVHAKLHVLPAYISSTTNAGKLIALAKALKLAKDELHSFSLLLQSEESMSFDEAEQADDSSSSDSGAKDESNSAVSSQAPNFLPPNVTHEEDDEELRKKLSPESVVAVSASQGNVTHVTPTGIAESGTSGTQQRDSPLSPSQLRNSDQRHGGQSSSAPSASRSAMATLDAVMMERPQSAPPMGSSISFRFPDSSLSSRTTSRSPINGMMKATPVASSVSSVVATAAVKTTAADKKRVNEAVSAEHVDELEEDDIHDAEEEAELVARAASSTPPPPDEVQVERVAASISPISNSRTQTQRKFNRFHSHRSSNRARFFASGPLFRDSTGSDDGSAPELNTHELRQELAILRRKLVLADERMSAFANEQRTLRAELHALGHKRTNPDASQSNGRHDMSAVSSYVPQVDDLDNENLVLPLKGAPVAFRAPFT